MGASEKLHEARRLAVDQRHAAPTPEALMKFSELIIVRRAVGDENESLR